MDLYLKYFIINIIGNFFGTQILISSDARYVFLKSIALARRILLLFKIDYLSDIKKEKLTLIYLRLTIFYNFKIFIIILKVFAPYLICFAILGFSIDEIISAVADFNFIIINILLFLAFYFIWFRNG